MTQSISFPFYLVFEVLAFENDNHEIIIWLQKLSLTLRLVVV